MFTMKLFLLNNWTDGNVQDLIKEISKIDCVVGMLLTACEFLELSEGLQFQVDGFGDSNWPVDVKTDLASVLEQTPIIIKKLQDDSGEFILDFFGQGIERSVHFVWESELVELKCLSRTAWLPNPMYDVMTLNEARIMFHELHDDFCKAIQNILPIVLEVQYYAEFCRND